MNGFYVQVILIPSREASVLSRGLIAEQRVIYRQSIEKAAFRLTDGYCLEDEHYSITHYEVKVEGNTVSVRSRH